MPASARFLSPSEAARRLGVSTKALRLYEDKGLLAPPRSAAGWRVYGPGEIDKAREIAALRRLGFSLAEIARVLKGDSRERVATLAAHQTAIKDRLKGLAATAMTLQALQSGHANTPALVAGDLMPHSSSGREPAIAFDLPWPWGGERFAIQDIKPLTYIIGPLGSGKTRLALRLAVVLPSAAFLGLERVEDGSAKARLDADPKLRMRVNQALAWLVEDGATVSEALVALLAGLEAEAPTVWVVDIVEHGLDTSTQDAVAVYLRRRRHDDRPLFLLTRSCAILDLASLGSKESITLCPANHSLPIRVAPFPGTPGYEAVATCLATPEVRARTEGVIAWHPGGAKQRERVRTDHDAANNRA